MTRDLYGPQHELIQQMIEECDRLDDEQLANMARALQERGYMKDDAAWKAAIAAGGDRVQTASKAAWDLDVSLKSNGFNRDPEVIRHCGWAVSDAGLAIATKDLLGTGGYWAWDFNKLMYPWRAGLGLPTLGMEC